MYGRRWLRSSWRRGPIGAAAPAASIRFSANLRRAPTAPTTSASRRLDTDDEVDRRGQETRSIFGRAKKSLYRIVANAACQKLRGRHGRQHEPSLDEVLPLFDERGRPAAAAADWSPRADNPDIQVELRTALTTAIRQVAGRVPNRADAA